MVGSGDENIELKKCCQIKVGKIVLKKKVYKITIKFYNDFIICNNLSLHKWNKSKYLGKR